MAWEYSEKTKQLFKDAMQGKPGTHLGEIEDADGVGEHGSIVCGDALKFMFRVKKAANPLEDVIEEAKYQTFGCTSAIAASEALCALIEGKGLTPVQALGITNRDIVEYLGGLPAQKVHCSVMGAEALEAAVVDWARKRGVDLKAAGVRLSGEKADGEDGRVVCRCFGLTEPYLRRKIKELKLRTVEDVTAALKAGGMCGACRYAPGGIQDLLNDEWGHGCESCGNAGGCAAAALAGAGEASPFQVAKKIEAALDGSVRPALRADGGDVELVDIKGWKVYCRLTGACHGCSGAMMTLKMLVENTLREKVDGRIEVIPV